MITLKIENKDIIKGQLQLTTPWPNIEHLDLSGCTSLTTLPNPLPDSLKILDLSGCDNLSYDSIVKITTLKETNKNNPDFRIIFPES